MSEVVRSRAATARRMAHLRREIRRHDRLYYEHPTLGEDAFLALVS